MKNILKTCATATTEIRGFLKRNNRWIIAAAFICFASGLVLSHWIEPGVSVQKVTLAEDTPALKFVSTGKRTAGLGLPDSEGKKPKSKSSTTVAPPYYVVRYEGSTNQGELKLGVSYALWLPPGVKTLRGVIVHQHGCGGWAWQEGELAVCDLHWQALARQHGCALLGSSYEEPYNCDCGMWAYPRYGSDKRFQQALADLARQSHHPELESVPWALWGHSGGATWVGAMLLLHPERVVGVWLRSGVAPVLPPPIPIDELRPLDLPAAACSVPVMCNLGAQEGITNTTNQFAIVWNMVQTFFRQLRGKGGLVGVAVEPNGSHNCGNSRYLAIPWFDACLSARLPEKPGETGLRPMPAENAWLAPLLGSKAQPAATFAGDAKDAIWLPNERIAKAWMEYVKDGNVSDATPPPSPLHVRASPTGELSWEAEADLESGLAGFIIERDGVELARVPKKLSGYLDGRPTFQRVGYGDAPALPLAEMRYRDHRFKWFKKHSYAVRAVNTVGLKSEPALAVEVNSSNMPPSAAAFPYEAILKQWPKAPEPPKLAVKFLDAVTGQYQFAPSVAFPAGTKVTVRREGDQLVWDVSGPNTLLNGVFRIIPESETNFFVKPLSARLTFIKDSKGQATAVVHYLPWATIPDCVGKKLKSK